MDTTLKQIVNENIIPHISGILEKVYEEREEVTIDGIKGFNGIDVFVPGKVVNPMSYLAVHTDPSATAYEKHLQMLKELIELTAPMKMKTWGYLNYLTGLYRIHNHGIWDQVISSEIEEVLKQQLDWRNFVNLEDLSLIHLPTNYYGVAFGVAGYRELLGWEQEGYSLKLFEKLMDHIDTYSGELCFMDETKGEGRFDRYSILIPGEICSLLMATKMEIPEKLKYMLRKSCDIYLQLANTKGHGYSYGRSIGTYGDTSALEVLSIAAVLEILTEEEKQLAYAYNTRTVQKFVDFWIDQDMQSINMWDKGRRTDGYRHKNRILGENMSLCSQILHIYEQWGEAGFENTVPMENYEEALEKLPSFQFYQFAAGEYDRGLVIRRDQGHVFSIPFVNGGGGTAGDVNGKSYYYATPYLPIPYENQVLEGAPDTYHAHLIPRIVLNNGEEIMPISYMKNLEAQEGEEESKVSYEQDQMCLVGEGYPRPSTALKSNTTYTFRSGIMEREDTFTPPQGINIEEVYMEFGTFSTHPKIQENKVIFEQGELYEIEVEGLGCPSVEAIQEDNRAYHTPHGRLAYRVQWTNKAILSDQPFQIKWSIKYK